MLEIVDNIYVFSTGRIKFGEIIASRTRDQLVGKDLFSQLSLSKDEGKFLSDEWARGRHRIMAANATRDGKDAPIILINRFCGAEILGLVVEILSDEPRVLRGALMQYEAVAASERVLEKLEEGFNSISAERKIGEFLNSVDEAENLKELAKHGIPSMYDALDTISRLVGVRIEVHQSVQGSVGFAGVPGYRVAASELFAIITILALAARENAPDRVLYVDIDRCDEAVSLSVTFDTGGKNFDAICEHIDYIADCANMIYVTSVRDGKLRCDLWPYVVDVSLVGLKNPDELMLAMFYSGEGLLDDE